MSIQELVRDDAKMIPRGQILKVFECHTQKFGCYPEGNREPLNGLGLGGGEMGSDRFGFVVLKITVED